MHMSAIYNESGRRNSARDQIVAGIHPGVTNLQFNDISSNHSLHFDCTESASNAAYDILKRHGPHTIDPILESFLILERQTIMAIFLDSNSINDLIQEIMSLNVTLRDINILSGIFKGSIVVFIDSFLDQTAEVREILNRYDPVHIFSSSQASPENQSPNL